MSSSENSFRAEEISLRTSLINPPQSPINPQMKSNGNPYQLIRIMNRKIKQQKDQLEEYQIALQSLNRQKDIILSERNKIEKNYLLLVHKIDNLKISQNANPLKSTQLNHILSNNNSINSYTSKYLSNTFSPSLKHQNSYRLSAIKSNILLVQNNKYLGDVKTTAKNKEISFEEDDYIPEPIKLSVKSNKQGLISQDSSKLEVAEHIYAENFIEDFIVIGPQVNQFKNKRSLINKNKLSEITTPPCSLYSFNKHYQNSKSQFISQIARRAFPEDCLLTKKLVESNQNLYDIIQFAPTNTLSTDYFVFTLKGDESLFKKKISSNRKFLQLCNPNNYLYILCLKLPDLVHVRDQKNYQRKQSEVWITEKVYSIVTYYPFFNILISLLYKIHNILWQGRIRRVIIQGENPMLWGITKNCFDLQKNEDIKDLLIYFSQKKPQPNQIYNPYNHYMGLMPEDRFKLQYSVSLQTCPIFFTSVCYEQMLLLLTAIFLQKTLVFISKYQSLSTMCALFFTNLLYPLGIETLLLNCDSQRLNQLIFQFPFSMVCSVKKTQKNFQKILYMFAQSNVARTSKDDARYIVIDLDTNTILYHQVLEQKLIGCLVSPGQHLKKQYLQINSCQPKSFSTTKALLRQNVGSREKPRSQIQKRQQQKRKYTKQYLQRINNNKTKTPTYILKPEHQTLLRNLTEYIQSFTIESPDILQTLLVKNKNLRTQMVKKYLLQKPIHKGKNKIIQNLLQSQIYANYLDILNQDMLQN